MVESENSVYLKNNKYVPANDAGRSFGYTSDYIARLAREKKISGKRIGHQWFVNPESLALFVSDVLKQKALRSNALRQERKKERRNKRANLSKNTPFGHRLTTTSRTLASLDAASSRLRTLLMAFGAVATGGLLGLIIYARPADEVRQFLSASISSTQTLTFDDVFHAFEKAALRTYAQTHALNSNIADMARGARAFNLTHQNAFGSQMASAFWSTVWCDAKSFFGFGDSCKPTVLVTSEKGTSEIPHAPEKETPQVPVTRAPMTIAQSGNNSPSGATKIVYISPHPQLQPDSLTSASYVTMRDFATGLIVLRRETQDALDGIIENQVEKRALRSTDKTADNLIDSIETRLALTGGTLTGSLTVTGDVTVDTDTLFIDSVNNRVGIGTTTPHWLLQTAGARPFFTLSDTSAGANLKHQFLSSQGGNLYIGNATDAYATTVNVTITNAGSVGIGTTSPVSKLSVVGESAFAGGASVGIGYAGTAAPTGGMIIQGSVGIGTTSPASLFSVHGNSYVSGTSFFGGAITGTSTLAIESTTATSTFSTGGLTVGTNQFLVQQTSGRIGIGTTSPASLIDIVQSQNGLAVLRARRFTDVAPAGDFIDLTTANGATTLFRVDNSGNLLAGGIITSGSQTITSISTPQFRIQYDPSNENTTTVSAAGATSYGFNGTTPIASWNPAANSVNTFSFNDASSNSTLSIDTTNRRVGIATTTPNNKLDIYSTTKSAIGFTGASGDTYKWTMGMDVTNGGRFAIASSTALGTTDRFVIDGNGNVGIGTTSPAQLLSVAGHCVTGDTRLRRRRRKKKNANGEWEYDDDEVMIKDIQQGDEIASLDEHTGKIVWSKVNALMDMGVKPIYKLTTASGKTIRTTAEHPYLVRKPPSLSAGAVLTQLTVAQEKNKRKQLGHVRQTLFRFEVDQSGRIEELHHDTVIGIANAEQRFTIVISAKLKRHFNELERRTTGAMKFFAPQLFADLIREALIHAPFEVRELIVDIEYTGYERVITRTITERFPQINVFFARVGKRSPAHYAAYGVFKGRERASVRRIEKGILTQTQDDRRTVSPLDKSQTIRSPRRSSSTVNISLRGNMSSDRVDNTATVKDGHWSKVAFLKEGQEIATMNDDQKTAVWDRIVSIEHLPAEQVYDIEVEGTHNFIGNDIVAHNTYLTGGLGAGIAETTNGNITGTGRLSITSTTATSTLSTGGLTIGTSQFVVQQTSGNVGIGTAPLYALDIASSGRLAFGGRPVIESGGVQLSFGSLVTGSQTTQINFFVNDPTTQRMVINSSGNVGIGTTSPQANLGMAGSIGVNSTQLVVAANGNVGLGIAEPGSRLVLSESTANIALAQFLSPNLSSGQSAGIYLGKSAGPDQTFVFNYNDNSVAASRYIDMSFYGKNSQLVVQDTGNVGIGTAAPLAQLEVAGTGILRLSNASAPEVQLRRGTNTGFSIKNNGGQLDIGFNASGDFSSLTNVMTIQPGAFTKYGFGTTSPSATFSFTGDNTGATRAFVFADSNNVEKFSILNNGNVGIGTTAPGSTLDIRAGVASVNVQATTVTDRAYVNFVNTSGMLTIGKERSVPGGLLSGDIAYAGVITTADANPLQFGTNNAVVMTMLTTGNVGIGTTSPDQLLTINGNLDFVKETARTISIGNSTTANTAGAQLNITGAASNGSATGGAIVITAGAGGNFTGGALTLVGGVGGGDNLGGAVSITGGASVGSQVGGALTLTSGGNGTGFSASGAVSIQSAAGVAGSMGGASGIVTLKSGTGGNGAGTDNAAGASGALTISTGNGGSMAGGASSVSGGAAGGAITVTGGSGGNSIGTGAGGAGSSFTLTAGNGGQTTTGTGGAAGSISLTAGNGGVPTGAGTGVVGGSATLTAGDGSLALAGGNLNFTGGTGGATNAAGGSLYLIGGAGGGSGVAGNVLLGINSGGTARGNVGIGTTSPASLLEVGGSTANVTFDGYLNCTGFTSNANGLLACTASDQRLKEDIVPLDSESGLAAITALNPVSFYWKDASLSTKQQYGLVAQDVEKIFPNLVQKTNPTPLTPNGTLTVNYDGLIAPLVKAVQELDAKLVALAAQVKDIAVWFTGGKFRVQSDVCVDDVCVTKEKFKELLQNSGSNSASVSASVPAPTTTATATTIPEVTSDSTASTNTATGTATSTTTATTETTTATTTDATPASASSTPLEATTFPASAPATTAENTSTAVDGSQVTTQ